MATKFYTCILYCQTGVIVIFFLSKNTRYDKIQFTVLKISFRKYGFFEVYLQTLRVLYNLIGFHPSNNRLFCLDYR